MSPTMHDTEFRILLPGWFASHSRSYPNTGPFRCVIYYKKYCQCKIEVVEWITHLTTSSSAPAYFSSLSFFSCATESYTAKAWFPRIARRVPTTSNGVKIAVLRSATIKYIVKRRGVISSMLKVPDSDNEGKIRRRSVPRPRTTYVICKVSARRSPGIWYSVHGRHRSVGVRSIHSECLGRK